MNAESADRVWQTKLHARLHDPIEKALVLLRDPAGHEGGTVAVLQRLLGFQAIPPGILKDEAGNTLHRTAFRHGIPSDIYEIVRRADWFASAADRPQWPIPTRPGAESSGSTRPAMGSSPMVRWASKPKLIHPLSGQIIDLGQFGNLTDTELDALKAHSVSHLLGLIQRQADGTTDWRRTALALWRFGPEADMTAGDQSRLGALWRLLPADTRIPDHSIGDHLDVTSAFAGAFASDPDGEASLLVVSLGPVQEFIAAARSANDLWAGSHLLARMAWEAMKPLCAELGPDAVVFPRLRGIPQVDLWLRDECGLPAALFRHQSWLRRASGTNPLFTAALPNRFVALVPRARATELAQRCRDAARAWVADTGARVVSRLLDVAGLPDDPQCHAYGQMQRQLAQFPEVHFATVPFSLVTARNAARQTDLDTAALTVAMAPYFGSTAQQAAGFLASPAWKVLSRETRWDDRTTFFAPNRGALYPALYDLAERALAAAKSTRAFSADPQAGWRCSLTGESEWLTTDPAQLLVPPASLKDSLWMRVARKRPGWAKRGEHLGGLASLKRVWPVLFEEEVDAAIGADDEVADREPDSSRRSTRRHVVSTHTMSLSGPLRAWLDRGAPGAQALLQEFQGRLDPVALPPSLLRTGEGDPRPKDHLRAARLVPALLDAADEDDDPNGARARELDRRVRNLLKEPGAGGPAVPSMADPESDDKNARIETYYGMLLMDGDRMGAWLAAEQDFGITYLQSFHPDIQAFFKKQVEKNPSLADYGNSTRALSPNRHVAISGALNDFSLVIARHVVERECGGSLLYAGGDDVLAMLPTSDLLRAMNRLRLAYSGGETRPADPASRPPAEADDAASTDTRGEDLKLGSGFAQIVPRRSRHKPAQLMRMMGTTATASCGGIIAHHQAPLGAVLRELRAAEHRAKNDGGRNAFSLSLVKRSGGSLHITYPWGDPMTLLQRFSAWLRLPGVSRRAVYNALDWLRDVPDNDANLIRSMLAWQLKRQSLPSRSDGHDVHAPIADMTALLVEIHSTRKSGQLKVDLKALRNFMSVAEFLARGVRSHD